MLDCGHGSLRDESFLEVGVHMIVDRGLAVSVVCPGD